MSNPSDLAIEALRAAEPRPEAVDRAVTALRRPHPPRLVPLAVGVAALSAVFLWPHPGNGLAWAQIAAQELPLRYHEVQEANGQTTRETWIDRALGAYRSRGGVPTGEGHDFIESRKGVYELIFGVAAFSLKPKALLPHGLLGSEEMRKRVELRTLLNSHRFRQLSVEQGVETRVGKADRYVLQLVPDTGRTLSAATKAEYERPWIAYVQSGTGRILGFDAQYLEGPGRITIDYPDRFPADTFVIPPKNGVSAYDLDAIDASARARLAAPIETLRAGGTEARLRLVVQDARNALWVIWSGTKPNGDLKERVGVLERHNGTAFGTMSLTNKDRLRRTPYGGHAVQLQSRVERVDLRIPVFREGDGRSHLAGYATVRNVRVLHVPYVRSVFPALGLIGRVY